MKAKWLLLLLPATLLVGFSVGTFRYERPERAAGTRLRGPVPRAIEDGSAQALAGLVREVEGLREEVRKQAEDREAREAPETQNDSESAPAGIDPELIELREAELDKLDRVLSRIVSERELSSDAAIELRQSLDRLGPEDHGAQMQRIAQLANSGAFHIAPHLERPF